MKAGHSLISDDYLRGELTVKQIAAKYNVCVRTVYNAARGKTGRRFPDRNRRALYLNVDEAEALLLSILESEKALPEKTRNIITGIESRLLQIADDLYTD